MIRFAQDPKNIVERVYKMAELHPEETALILPDQTHLNYREIKNRTESLREKIRAQTFAPRERVLVLFPFDEKFVFLIMALFAQGLVPVIIDPRVPRKLWKNLLQESSVKRIFLTGKIKKWRFLGWWMNSFQLINVDKLFSGAIKSGESPLTETADHDEVLVTLTSGTTGLPKRVSRTFGIIKNQQLLSCRYLPVVSRDIHLALYGIGVLQSLAEGACTVLLPTSLQQPKQLIKSILAHKVTRVSGPPGLMTDFLLKVESDKVQLPSLENLITGGAPLPRWWFKKAKAVLPATQVTILYGSTECEPISAYPAEFNSEQAGYPVGMPVPELELTKLPFSEVNGQRVFEVVLKGPNCASSSPEGLRTGDLALEKNGSLWLLGRKTEALGEIPIAFIEEPLERVPGIKRVAIKVTRKHFQVFFEVLPGIDPQTVINDIETKARELMNLYGLKDLQIKNVEKIPVDPRHGWKIQRSLLK